MKKLRQNRKKKYKVTGKVHTIKLMQLATFLKYPIENNEFWTTVFFNKGH